MAKLAVLYESVHHGNTRKLLEGLAAACDVDLLEASRGREADLSRYRAVGFASGIYFSKFHESILKLAVEKQELPQKAFLIYTCGSGSQKYGAPFARLLEQRGLQVLGAYGCRGFDTYGPFRLIGGISRRHPSAGDISGCVRFLRETVLPGL